MSSWGSSSQDEEDNNEGNKFFTVFQNDFFLSNSLHIIEQWKNSISNSLQQKNKINAMKYLQAQFGNLKKQQNLLLAPYHIRSFAFCYFINQALNTFKAQYIEIHKNKDIQQKIKTISYLDNQIIELTEYIQYVEQSRVCSYAEEIQADIISKNYVIIKQIFPLVLNEHTIWKLVLLIESFRSDQLEYLLNVPFNMKHDFYQKCLKEFQSKSHAIRQIHQTISKLLQKNEYKNAYLQAVELTSEKPSLKQQYKCDYLNSLRNLYYCLQANKSHSKDSLFREYIFSTLKIPFHQSKKNLSTEYYENLFLQVIQNGKNDPKLFDVAIYQDPTILQISKRTKLGQIEAQLFNMMKEVQQTKKQFLKHQKQIDLQKKPKFVRSLLDSQKFMTVVRLLGDIMENNRQVFTTAVKSVYQIYMNIANFLKEIYLSFGSQCWLCPQSIFTPLTLKTFRKISQDIKADVKSVMYHMVDCLNKDNLPNKVVFQNNQFCIEKVSKLQYLSVIMFYMDDCSKQQEYLSLPQLAPINFQTSVLLIKSLHMKLKHHEPNTAQLPLFTDYLKQCQSHKLKISFNWFKQNLKTNTDERQLEFQIEVGLKIKEIQQLFRKCLNYRDRQFARKIIQENHNNKHQITCIQIANFLKYNTGIANLPRINSSRCNQFQHFALLDEMKIMLSLKMDDLFSLQPYDQININYLHLLLTFYNDKYTDAPGSEIYAQMVSKIMKEYLNAPTIVAQKFRTKYPKFFSDFIYKYHTLQIFYMLNDILAQKDKVISFYGQIKQKLTQKEKQTYQEAVLYVKNKISIVREQYFLNLDQIKEQLLQFIMAFASLLSQNVPFQIFIEATQFVVKMLIKVPQLKNSIQLQLFFTQQRLKNKHFIEQLISYFSKQTYVTQQERKVLISKFLISNIQNFMDNLQLKSFLKLIKLYIKINQIDLQTWSFGLWQVLNQHFQQNKIRASHFFIYFLLNVKQNYDKKDIMLSMFNQNQQQIQQAKTNYPQILSFIRNCNQQFWSQSRIQMKNIKIDEYKFLVDLIKQIKDDQSQQDKTVSLKSIWFQYISRIQNVDMLFYYAAKLQAAQLIIKHPKIKQILTQFMLYSNFTNQLFPIFKIILNQYKDFGVILQAVIKEYQLGKIIVLNQNFYNKLILINQKYPNALIENIILKWINSSQKKDPVKIHQQYYLNEIKTSLKQIPTNLAQSLILQVHQSPQSLLTLIQKTDKIFFKILYFPLKSYQNFDMSKKDQLLQQQQGWQTDSENQQKKQATQKKNDKKQDQMQKSEESVVQSNAEQNNDNHDSNNQDDSQIDYQKPDILKIFYQEQSAAQFKQYKKFMILREQVDVCIKSDYKILEKIPIKDNQYLCNKILQLQKILQNFQQSYQLSIIDQMPKELHSILKQMGYKLERRQDQILKKRKPSQTKYIVYRQRFSDRQQSDYQSDDQDDDQDSNDYQDNDDDYSDQNGDDQDQSLEQQMEQAFYGEEKEIQLPQLQPQLSKIQSQIKGTELGRAELIQIMDIYLIQLLILHNSIFRQKHIVSAFSQLVQSKFGSMFLESVFTVLRLEENQSASRKTFLQKLKKEQKYNPIYQLEDLVGLGQLDKMNAFQNVVSILKQISDKNKMLQVDPLNRQSTILLPIAEEFFSLFNLPLQSNMMTFAFLYLQSKSKLQEFISSNLTIGHSVAQKIQKKYFKRICRVIATENCPHRVWEYFQNGLNYQIKFQDKLLGCLDIYSQQLFKRMCRVNQRMNQILKMEMHTYNLISEEQQKQVSTLHLNQRLYYLLYNLVSSCSKQIKQFYFANKDLIKTQFQNDNDQENDDENFVPKSIKRLSNKIMTNKNLILLVQMVFRIIKTLQKHFFGKIQEKKFNKLIKPLKLVVQTATMYIDMCQKSQNWKFQSLDKVQLFIQNYKPGQYKFKRLVEVYNIILSLLNISSFCTSKFKKILIPYFIKYKQLATSIPLMFKVPTIEEETDNAQYIFLTRECSFDMAFYQVRGKAILVQFHEQEGSDHGGMIRQLMMGWKGHGIGQQNFFFGKLLGISFNQSVPYGGYIDLAMCIKITGYKVTIENMKELDQDIYKSLKYIIQNDPSCLELTFEIQKFSHRTLGLESYLLKDKGNEIKLTDLNKKQYIQLYLKKYYQIGRQQELSEIATGFYTVVNPQYAKIFRPNQLLQHLRGKQILDINLLKKHVKYQQGYTEGSVIIKWFWQILQDLNQQTMNKFIQFLTGSPKIPIFNLGFQVVIQRAYDVQNLPVAQTCFNTLDLPQYGTKQILEKKLMQAIMEGNQNFGIL